MKCALAGILLAHVAFGQAAAHLAFEKADVQISLPGTREEGGFLPDGRFECHATTMLKLISVAYGANADQVTGGPAWLATDVFDIAAKAHSGKASRTELLEMLRTLLADRFGLVVEEQQKDMPVFLLAVGPKGPKLQASAHPQSPDCPSVDGDASMNHRACRDYGMADLVKLLPRIAKNYIDRPVIDITGLTGFYNFRLDWTSKPTYLAAKSDGAAAVSLSEALGKLGLKLEPGTRPMPAIVVERLNPTPAEGSVKGAEAPAHFEVAEVRPSKATAERRGLSALPSGEVEILGYTARELMMLAFEVKGDRIAGGPKWLDSDRFDVIAKSPDAMSPHAIGGMLKTLMADRFKLETHTEDRPLSVFALVSPKESPKLRESDGAARSQCDLVVADNGRSYNCRNTTMAQLADRLPAVAQAYLTLPMVDLTGLKGAYDFTLTWTPKNPRSDRRGPDVAGQASTPAGGLTVFEAIERQLGLKIEERKSPLPVIVVDGAEKPVVGNQ
jgi:uncharacterized protein (TIGR03435 family)